MIIGNKRGDYNMVKLTRRELAIINAMKYLKKNNDRLGYYAHYNSMYKYWDYCLYDGNKILGTLKISA